MNSGKSKTSDCAKLLQNLSDKIILKQSDKYFALLNLSIYYTWKNIKNSHKKKKNLKYQVQHGIKKLNYLTDHILYQIFEIVSSIS